MLDPRTETAIRTALKVEKFFYPLTENQILGIIRKFEKLVNEGHAEDYSFMEAMKRFKPPRHATTQTQ